MSIHHSYVRCVHDAKLAASLLQLSTYVFDLVVQSPARLTSVIWHQLRRHRLNQGLSETCSALQTSKDLSASMPSSSEMSDSTPSSGKVTDSMPSSSKVTDIMPSK